MCPVTTTSSLVKCLCPYTVMFINTQLYFDNQVSCLIRGWRFHQVLSLKYFFNGAIAPVRCTGVGAGAALLFGAVCT